MIRGCVAAVAGICVLLCLLTGAAVAGAHPAGALLAPLTGARITQVFGCTALVLEPIDRACPQRHWHSGVDLAAPLGTPVRAAAAGIAHVYATATGYGLYVIVDHGSGLTSLYGHLSSVTVLNGDSVDAGQQIGCVGSTGNSTGPHLHFEIRRDGIAEDPANDVQLP